MSMRSILLILFMSASPFVAAAQPVDGIIGKKRSRVQQMLREYRILDYQKTRVEYALDKGLRQTVIFKNDTCTAFFWAVNTDRVPDFMGRLQAYGYALAPDSSLVRNGIVVRSQRLESGKAVLFSASLDESIAVSDVAQFGSTQKNGGDKQVKDDTPRVRGPIVLPLPLMQQAALIEDADTTVKVKDPTRNWVGGADTEVMFLGY